MSDQRAGAVAAAGCGVGGAFWSLTGAHRTMHAAVVLSERGRVSREPEVLVEAVRGALGPAISASNAVDNRLPVLTVEPLIEQSLLEALRTGDSGTFLAIDPLQAERLAVEVANKADEAEQRGVSPVLVCSAQLRPAVRRLTRTMAPRLPVLSYSELGPQLQLETI